MISKEPPKKDFIWAKCLVGPTNALRTWAISDFEDVDSELIEVHHRDLLEGIHTGLSKTSQKKRAINYDTRRRCPGDARYRHRIQ